MTITYQKHGFPPPGMVPPRAGGHQDTANLLRIYREMTRKSPPPRRRSTGEFASIVNYGVSSGAGGGGRSFVNW